MTERFLLVFAVSLVLAADPVSDEVKKEIERFEGTWKFVSLETEGRKLDEKVLEHPRLIIKGDRFTSKEGETTHHGVFKVDPTKKPKTIDVTFTDGPEKGKTMLGIYELEGDTYKVCFSLGGKNRPTEFATKAGTNLVLETLKREKR
jgi:uncharacterized protein (TIGR03067 family)